MTLKRYWMPHIRELILKRDEHKCVYCNKPANGIDHVIPVSEGGLTIPANGVCCCVSCNGRKYNKLDERWMVKGLQRLIQHGENINWIAAIRPDEPSPMQRAIPILWSSGMSVQGIMEITGLSWDEVDEFVDGE